ncbi:MAG: hypothetical protein GF370_00925 [Candidatus Nealsonbacteria bacterium]|nr:hypothetical protein [Candidatus Nealsonbacteria bacterium]
MQLLKVLGGMKQLEGKQLLDQTEGSLVIPIVKQGVIPDEGLERAISQLSSFMFRPNVQKTEGATKKIISIINFLQDKLLEDFD